MTPLRPLLDAEGLRTPEALTERLLAQIHAEGFEWTMEFWLKRIERRLAADDAFSRERGRQFVSAAALFDATGARAVAEFVSFMERHVVRDAEVAGVVKVMTIHKAKGLGFDVVVLPDLEGKSIDQRRDGLAVQRAADRSVEWVLDLPTKLFFEHDETLARHVRAAEMEACHEALALLYVGMTRAKRAMYAITKPPGKSESRNYPKLLATALGDEAQPLAVGKLACVGGWSAGDSRWHEAVEARTAPAIAPLAGTGPNAGAMFSRAPRRPARRPSAERAGLVNAAQAFALEGGAAADFGIHVHALLAEIEWRETAQFSEWARRGVPPAAVAEARDCVESGELSEVWSRRAGVEVWRERAFEIVLDGAWVAGVFDRVLVGREQSGRAQWVKVFDFKSEHVSDRTAVAEAVLRHGPQLNLYRQAAAVLAGVAPGAVSCELVFTHLRRRVAVLPA